MLYSELRFVRRCSTKGVLPVPPTLRLPTPTVSREWVCVFKTPQSKSLFLKYVIKPYIGRNVNYSCSPTDIIRQNRYNRYIKGVLRHCPQEVNHHNRYIVNRTWVNIAAHCWFHRLEGDHGSFLQHKYAQKR